MDKTLSTKTLYLATLYRFLLQLLRVIVYAGRYLFAIIEVVSLWCKQCCIGFIQSLTEELAKSEPPNTTLGDTDDRSQFD